MSICFYIFYTSDGNFHSFKVKQNYRVPKSKFSFSAAYPFLQKKIAAGTAL